MKNIVRWCAIILLLPFMVIVEIKNTLAEAGVEMPNADDTLSSLKQAREEQVVVAKTRRRVKP